MKVLFATPQPPERFGGGGSIILAHLVALSSKVTECELVYLGPKSSTVNIDDFCEHAYYVSSLNTRQKMKSLIGQNAFTSLGVYANENEALLRELANWCDVAWVEFTKTANVIKTIRECDRPVVCYAHNFERDYYTLSEPRLGQLFKTAIARNEADSLRWADLLLGISRSCVERASIFYQMDVESRFLEVPPFLWFSHQSATLSRPEQSLRYVLLTGSFAYLHNQRSLIEFLSEVWPTVSKLYSDVSLMVSGSGLEKVSSRLLKSSNVMVVNRPKDEIPLLRNSAAFINPTLNPAGVQIKNLLPMALGIPLIGSPESFAGYMLRDRVHALMISGVSSMADALGAVLSNDNLSSRLSFSSRRLFQAEYSLEVGVRRVRAVLELMKAQV